MAKSNSMYHDLAVALSPVVFAQSLGIEPDPWQSEVLHSDSKRIILNCARQTGKSSIVAILALHHALYRDKSIVLIVSHTLQQAAETFRKCCDYYRQIARPILPITQSAYRLELQNGSRIVTLTGQRPDSIRGYSAVTLLIVDEASQVTDEAYQVAQPMLVVSGGRTILLSTPHGREGFFYNAWHNEDDWLKIHVPWTECPRLTAEEIERERRSFPSWFFRQEYECSFEEGNQSIINPEAIRRSFKQRPALDIDFMDESLDYEDENSL